MGDAIMEELEKYAKLATDDMKDAVKDTAKLPSARIFRRALRSIPASTRKAGRSRMSMRTPTASTSWCIPGTATRSRTFWSTVMLSVAEAGSGQPHIAAAEQRGNEKLVETIKQKLKGG
jgi:hypothetical protein